MISLIINKCLKLRNSTNCGQNDTDFVNTCETIDVLGIKTKLRQLFLNQLMFKFKVNAIENEVKENNINLNNNNNNNISVDTRGEEPVIGSKQYMEQLKAMTIWESIQYLLHRNVDTKEQSRDIYIKEGETGLDRVKLMFTEHLNGEDNAEMRFIMQSFGWGLIGGGFYGGILGNRTAVQDFIRRHNEYVFRGDFEAKRRIHDTMYLQFVRQGMRWSWRISLFTGCLTGLTTTAIAYRNDVYIRDCVISGFLVCSLWKLKLGLRGMAVSGVVGSIFGAIFGSSLKLMLWTFNTTVPEYRHWRHVRYLGHLEVEKYEDGSTEYDWNIAQKDTLNDPNSQNIKQNSSDL